MALPMMTQTELVGELSERTGWNRSDVKRVLGEIEELLQSNIANCTRTRIAGLVVEPKLRKATKKRRGRNPATGEEVMIAAKPASVRVAIRALKPLKEAAPTARKLQSRS